MVRAELLSTLEALAATPRSATSLQDSARPMVEVKLELKEVLVELVNLIAIHFLEENKDSEAALAQVGAQMEDQKADYPREAQASETVIPGASVHGVREGIPMVAAVLLEQVLTALAGSAETQSSATLIQDSDSRQA